jgi:dTDP-4-amino-4,6-dideoxygalactose transaminase
LTHSAITLDQAEIDAMFEIPVMRPRLPAAERLIPYLKKIDATQIYSNYGPLACALEERLAQHFRLPPEAITTVANATLGLTLALAVQAPPPGTLCAIPAWTFIATAHAAIFAGLTPYFIDVDVKSGMLDAERVKEEIARAPAPVGAIMPVAPFGRPIDVAAWDSFRSETGLAVVIDAAASFDSLLPGSTPAVVSLHATKVIGVGEGGFVASTDASLIRSIRARANFGFYRKRDAIAPGVNAKLSEYHAAVGLSALDEWADARTEWMAAARAYRLALPDSKLQFQDGFGQSWIASTCVLSVPKLGGARVKRDLAAAGIDTRRWWEEGAHAHRATAGFPRQALPNTGALAHAAIGLPFYRDLATDDIRRIADVIHLGHST